MNKHAEYHKRMKDDRIKKLKKDYQDIKKDFINARINGMYDRIAFESMEIIALELRKLGSKP